ncbi:hypothetical protein CVS37_22745 [Burkholderia lata]|nr:hypothetical protein CVS37_22745 [Burkholderia lata]
MSGSDSGQLKMSGRGLSIAHLLSVAESVQSRCVDRHVERVLGVTTLQASLLHVLDCGKLFTVGELSDTCGIASSAVTRLVDRLAALYLVTRMQNEDDRRIVHVSLTCDGRRVAAAWRDVQFEIQRGWRAFANDDELRMMGNLLSRMLVNAAPRDASG